jgi:DNA-binding response OmpR family regulator
MASILIVEPNVNHRPLYETELPKHGYEVEFADDGSDAIRRLQDKQFDLVIVNLSPKGLQAGSMLTRTISRAKPNVPIIVQSSTPLWKTSFKSWMASAFLVKSVDLGMLIEKMKELLKRHTRTRAKAVA